MWTPPQKARSVLARAAERAAGNEPAILVTRLSDGAKRILPEAPGQPLAEPYRLALQRARTERHPEEGELFLEPLRRPPRLVILGGGHVGCELAWLGDRVGLRTLLVDDRPEHADPDRLPRGTETVCRPFPEFLERLEPDPAASYVIVTRGHRSDFHCLEALIEHPRSYLGMIGSRRKVAAALKALRAAGRGENELQRIHAPVGLNLGGRSPAEVALAVLAEIQAVRHGTLRDGTVSALSARRQGDEP